MRNNKNNNNELYMLLAVPIMNFIFNIGTNLVNNKVNQHYDQKRIDLDDNVDDFRN